MATRANAFGFKVLAAEIAPDVGFCEANRVTLVPLEELLRRVGRRHAARAEDAADEEHDPASRRWS